MNYKSLFVLKSIRVLLNNIPALIGMVFSNAVVVVTMEMVEAIEEGKYGQPMQISQLLLKITNLMFPVYLCIWKVKRSWYWLI